MTGAPAGLGAPASPSPDPAKARISGIDLARAVAIVGMVMVHIGPTDADGLAGQAYALSHGRASLLFVLLAGIGVSLLDRGRSAGLTPVRLVWRAVVLLPVGLLLQDLDHGVAVILQDYAVLFVVALALRPLPDRALLVAAFAAFALGPSLHVALEYTRPDLVDGLVTTIGDPPAEIARRLIATGAYPLITWVAPFALGMWLGRRDLTTPRTLQWLFAVGAPVAVAALWLGGAASELLGPTAAGWWALALDTEPHSQSHVWLWSSSAAAVVALAVCLAAAMVWSRLVHPLVALGQLALTVYVTHLFVIDAFEDVVRVDDVAGAALRVAVFTVVASLLALGWRMVFRRGPLEAVLHAPIAGVAWLRSRPG